MSYVIVMFKLTMPNNNSWNGHWSGESKQHLAFERMTPKRADKIVDNGPYYHHFGDGWSACVTPSIIDGTTSRKMRRKSSGFCGYDWMIWDIRLDGEITGRNAA